jgi:uncharacterized membrane protein
MRHPAVFSVMALVIAVFGCCADFALAGQGEMSLTVVVIDSTGAVVPGAQIRADVAGGARGKLVKSGKNGEASLELRPGKFDLFVSAAGFKEWGKHIVVGNVGKQSVEVKLKIVEATTVVSTCAPCYPIGTEQVVVKDPGSATILISVTDRNGVAVPFAQVWVTRLGETKTLEADTDGKISVGALPGSLDVVVSCPGYMRWKKSVVVRDGETQTLSVVLGDFDWAGVDGGEK